MSVTREDVAAIAALARLQLSPDEAERLAAELSEILAHVAVLEAVDVAAAMGAAEGAAPLRADAVGPDALVAGPASFAPEWRAGFFIVPRLPALDRDADDAP